MAKKYQVELTATAEADILSAQAYIGEQNPIAADRWVAKFEKLIQGLQRHPRAHEVIPEAPELGREYRHKLFGKYRIIYRIDGARVIVLRVYHSARLLDLSVLLG